MRLQQTHPTPYRILVADDHALVRRGVRDLLESDPEIEVCGEAATGSQTIEQIDQFKPDMLLLDLTMPGPNGPDVIREIRRRQPSVAVLIVSMHSSTELITALLQLGINGYVLKSDADTDLTVAINAVRHGNAYFAVRSPRRLRSGLVMKRRRTRWSTNNG